MAGSAIKDRCADRNDCDLSPGRFRIREGLPAAFKVQACWAMIQHYRDLMVWQKAMVLVERTYAVTALLPASERFGLASQIRRAAVSIPSNIAEGSAIRGKSYLRHLRIALGSEAELQTQVELTVRLGLLKAGDAEPILARASEVGRMLRGLIKSLKAKSEQVSPDS